MMKRISCLLVSLMLLVSVAIAEDIDLKALTDEQLKDLKTQIDAELALREANDTLNNDTHNSEVVLYDQDGIKLYLTGEHTIREIYDDRNMLDLTCIIVNNSSAIVSLIYRDSDCSINDWETGDVGYRANASSLSFEARPGKKAKGVICFDIYKADIKDYSEIESIEFTLHLFYNNIIHSKTIHLEPKDGNIILVE